MGCGQWRAKIRQDTHRLEPFDELLGALVVLEVLEDEHDEVVVFELAEVLRHLPLDERLELAVDHGLGA